MDVEASTASCKILEMTTNMHMNLPELIRPNSTVCTPCKMELVFLPKAEEFQTTVVVKHFKFDEEVEPVVVKAVCQGICNVVSWGSNAPGGPKAVAFLMDKLGGDQFRYWTFDAELAEKTMSKCEIDKGIDFILAEAPRTNAELAQTCWFMHQLADPESPVYKFSKRDIKECLSQIKETSVAATKQTYLPVCWLDMSIWFRDILQALFPTLK